MKINAKDIALIVSFAALIAVSAIVPAIPVAGPVAITLQTFSVLLTGALLGALRSFLAVLLYLAVGLVGLPIFAGGAAGVAPFFGPSVGYLVSFPLAALLLGYLAHRTKAKGSVRSALLIFVFANIATILVIYPLGLLGMMWRADLTFTQAFMANLVFVPGDLIKAALVGIVAAPVLRAFPNLRKR